MGMKEICFYFSFKRCYHKANTVLQRINVTSIANGWSLNFVYLHSQRTDFAKWYTSPRKCDRSKGPFSPPIPITIPVPIPVTPSLTLLFADISIATIALSSISWTRFSFAIAISVAIPVSFCPVAATLAFTFFATFTRSRTTSRAMFALAKKLYNLTLIIFMALFRLYHVFVDSLDGIDATVPTAFILWLIWTIFVK